MENYLPNVANYLKNTEIGRRLDLFTFESAYEVAFEKVRDEVTHPTGNEETDTQNYHIGNNLADLDNIRGKAKNSFQQTTVAGVASVVCVLSGQGILTLIPVAYAFWNLKTGVAKAKQYITHKEQHNLDPILNPPNPPAVA